MNGGFQLSAPRQRIFKVKTTPRELIHLPVIIKHTSQFKPGRSPPTFPCDPAAAAAARQLFAAVRFPSPSPKYVQPLLRKQSAPFAVVT